MSLDQFYTKDDVAAHCYHSLEKFLDVNSYDTVLEPSAGKGAFYKLFPKDRRVGIDLDPKYDTVQKMDFFDYHPPVNTTCIVVGNPPFGKISSTAVKFFNHAAAFADAIAFIVPRTFKRISIQNKLSMSFELCFNEDIPLKPCCFEPAMGAKCCFQIWKKTDVPRSPVVFKTTHEHFKFLKHGPKDERGQPTPPMKADFAMKAYGSNCGRIQCDDLQSLRPKSWHWIEAVIDVDELIARFDTLDYSFSKDTVRQDSIGQKEVIKLYSDSF